MMRLRSSETARLPRQQIASREGGNTSRRRRPCPGTHGNLHSCGHSAASPPDQTGALTSTHWRSSADAFPTPSAGLTPSASSTRSRSAGSGAGTTDSHETDDSSPRHDAQSAASGHTSGSVARPALRPIHIFGVLGGGVELHTPGQTGDTMLFTLSRVRWQHRSCAQRHQ